jgi:hypothetical protein
MVLLFSSSSSIRQIFHLPSLALCCSRNFPPGRRGLFVNKALDTMLPEKTVSSDDQTTVADLSSLVTQLVPDDTGAGQTGQAAPSRPDYPWRRAKKVAAMLSFFGMQRNPGMRTIEEELMAAFRHNPRVLSLLFFLHDRGRIQ